MVTGTWCLLPELQHLVGNHNLVGIDRTWLKIMLTYHIKGPGQYFWNLPGLLCHRYRLHGLSVGDRLAWLNSRLLDAYHRSSVWPCHRRWIPSYQLEHRNSDNSLRNDDGVSQPRVLAVHLGSRCCCWSWFWCNLHPQRNGCRDLFLHAPVGGDWYCNDWQ